MNVFSGTSNSDVVFVIVYFGFKRQQFFVKFYCSDSSCSDKKPSGFGIIKGQVFLSESRVKSRVWKLKMDIAVLQRFCSILLQAMELGSTAIFL